VSVLGVFIVVNLEKTGLDLPWRLSCRRFLIVCSDTTRYVTVHDLLAGDIADHDGSLKTKYGRVRCVKAKDNSGLSKGMGDMPEGGAMEGWWRDGRRLEGRHRRKEHVYISKIALVCGD